VFHKLHHLTLSRDWIPRTSGAKFAQKLVLGPIFMI